MDQLPPDSHWAMASQLTESAFAVAVDMAIWSSASAPKMTAASRPLVTPLRIFITAVLPRPFELGPPGSPCLLRCGYPFFRVMNLTCYECVKSFSRYLSGVRGV